MTNEYTVSSLALANRLIGDLSIPYQYERKRHDSTVLHKPELPTNL